MIRVLGVARHSVMDEPFIAAEPKGLTVAEIAPTLRAVFGGRLSVAEIQHTVSAHYRIKPEYMTERDGVPGMREPSICYPRQMAMFLAREMTGHSLPSIGRFFGNRDHTTVLHAVRAVKNRCAEDPYTELDLAVLREKLSA